MTGQRRPKANAQQSYTLASRTSQRKVQSLPKRMPAPTQEKIQNITSPQSLPPRGLCGTTRISQRNERNAKKCALEEK